MNWKKNNYELQWKEIVKEMLIMRRKMTKADFELLDKQFEKKRQAIKSNKQIIHTLEILADE